MIQHSALQALTDTQEALREQPGVLLGDALKASCERIAKGDGDFAQGIENIALAWLMTATFDLQREGLQEVSANAVIVRAKTALLETLPGNEKLDSAAFAYALAAQQSLTKAWADGSAPDTFSRVQILHRGFANEAAYWTFDTSEGEQYTVQVQRTKSRDAVDLEEARTKAFGVAPGETRRLDVDIDALADELAR